MYATIKYVAFSTLALFCAGSFANAQSTTPAELSRQIPKPPVAAGQVAGGSGRIASPSAAPLSNGANSRHCYAGWWYTDQSYSYVYAFNTEGDYIYFYSSSFNLTAPQAALLDVCRSGHEYVAYYNSSSSPYSVYDIELES